MHAEASRGVCVRCARAAKCAAAEIIVAITILEQVHVAMQEKYNFPLKLLILDREYKHVLTWQKTGDETFDIEKPEPPTDVPDPTLLSRSGASLAQGGREWKQKSSRVLVECDSYSSTPAPIYSYSCYYMLLLLHTPTHIHSCSYIPLLLRSRICRSRSI